MQLENVDDVYALSPIQEGMLFHTVSEPGAGVFVEQIACTISGDLKVDLFREAWVSVIARHTALRTIFLWDGLDEPVQVVRQKVEIPWSVVDWSKEATDRLQKKLADFLATDRRLGFDLAEAPLMRMKLIRLSDHDVRFIWTFHHLLTDGWSTSLVLKEVFSAYTAIVKNEQVQTGATFLYRDFIAYLQSQSPGEAEKFWRSQLAGFATPTRLLDQTRRGDSEVGSTGHERQRFTLSADLSRQLREFARTHRLTLNTVVLGAWALLLGTWSREQEVVFGATVSGRPPELAGIETAIGLFINTLPMRIRVDESDLIQWLQAIQRQQIEVRKFEQTSLAAVQRWSDTAPGEALFENIVVFENYPEPMEDELESVGISVSDFDYLEQSNYPLALLVVPGDCLYFYLVHQKSRFSAAFSQKLLANLQQILQSFVDSPRAKLQELELLSPDEYHKVTCLWNSNLVDLDFERTLHSLIECHADQQANKVAVVFGDESFTYRQLDDYAVCVAAELKTNGVCVNDRVGLFVERSPEMIVGILGILKSGAAYVPMDPTYPTSHLKFIATDANLAAVVTQSALSDSVPAGISTVVVLDANLHPAQVTLPVSSISADDTAYVIYTSGSQGTPKGVQVSHRNIVHSTLARRNFYPDRVDRFLLLSSFSFDSSMVGIFWTLVDGGTLILPPHRLEQDLARLAEIISTKQVTHLLSLPSLYKLLLQHEQRDSLNSLRTVIVAGEECPESIVLQHLEALPATRLYNEYGPTECSVWCTACELTAASLGGPVPIGLPIANTQTYVLDRYQRPVPPGICGELYVAGAGLTKGYLNRQELTQTRFVNNPFSKNPTARMYRTGDLAYHLPNGQLVFAGRVDNQVKIRGYRIELGEIENALEQHASVSEAIVVARALDGAPSMDNEPDGDSLLDSQNILTQLNRIGPIQASRLLDKLMAIPEDELDRVIAERNS